MAGYPGRKTRQMPDGHDLIVDYFYGSGGYSASALVSNPRASVIGAESNPRMVALHLADSDRAATVEAIANAAAIELKQTLNPAWDGRGSYGDLFPADRAQLGRKWIEKVKIPFDAAEGLAPDDLDDSALASQLLVSSLSFGCNIRASSNGLNVPPNAQKLRTFKQIVPFQKSDRLAFLLSDAAALEFDSKRAIALIDPPYAVPRHMRNTHKLLTACYPGHEPYGQVTWDLYWATISKAMRGGAKTIAVANYWSSEMDAGISALASAFGYQIVSRRNFGPLGSQDANHRFKHGRRAQAPGKLPHLDFEWILRRRSGFRAGHEQGCLFFS